MTTELLVQSADGSYSRRSRADLQDTDMVAFNDPDDQAELEVAEATLDTEIEAAGGFEKWKASAQARDDRLQCQQSPTVPSP